MLGSAISEVVKANLGFELLIVKKTEKRADKEDGSMRWAVCIDGSKTALHALERCLRYINKETDFIDVIHVRKLSLKE